MFGLILLEALSLTACAVQDEGLVSGTLPWIERTESPKADTLPRGHWTWRETEQVAPSTTAKATTVRATTAKATTVWATTTEATTEPATTTEATTEPATTMEATTEPATTTEATTAPATTAEVVAVPTTTAEVVAAPATTAETTTAPTTAAEVVTVVSSTLAAPDTEQAYTTETETETEPPRIEESTTMAETSASEETTAAEPAWEESTEPEEPQPSLKRIWVGDSRMVGVRDFAQFDEEKDVFIAEIGQGLGWFETEALPMLQDYLNQGEVGMVLFNLGINDCAATYQEETGTRAGAYINHLNKLAEHYPQVRFLICSLGPCQAEKYAGRLDIAALNREAAVFNAEMKEAFPETYIPAGEYLASIDYRTWDGMHYDAETTRDWYAYVHACLTSIEP